MGRFCEHNSCRSIATDGALLVPVLAGAGIGSGVNVGITYAVNGGNVSGSQLGAGAVNGAIGGAVASVAGPLGGSLSTAIGESAASATAIGTGSGIAAIGSASGQAAANAIDPNNQASLLLASLFGGVGQSLSSLVPVRGVYTLNQASYFAPSTISGLVGSANSANLLNSYLVGDLVGTAPTFGGTGNGQQGSSLPANNSLPSSPNGK